VQAGVARRGAYPFRLDSDRFPGEYRLTTLVNGDGVTVRLRTQNIELPVHNVGSVWLRRIFGPSPPVGLTDLEADQCVRESRAALDGFLSALVNARWFDPLARVREAENKLVQLREAQRVGLHVPRTAVGNDPDEVRSLWTACAGQLVAKMLTPVTCSMGPPAAAVYTHTVSASDIEDLEGLALAPMIFQERIDKRRELRVVYVAGRCFVGSLDATSDDWRRPTSGPNPRWHMEYLPDDVATRLDALMCALGLRFGVADFLAARDGSYVFLELNPIGEWGMLERDLDLPIADAIAEELCKQP
jgi:glutathione synthase/RimK-type ligase-like ATP-grasp enzyme